MAENTVRAAHSPQPEAGAPGRRDYAVRRGDRAYAGIHLLVDFWGASSLDDTAEVERALRAAAAACGATLLHLHLHRFSENGGVSGVAVLAESHISVHTWPEYRYAAFDVFMCGACDPHPAVAVLRRIFRPAREEVGERKRGVLE